MGAKAWFFLRPRPGELRSLAQSAVDDFFFRDGRLPADEEGLAEILMITPSRWTLTETTREVRLPAYNADYDPL